MVRLHSAFRICSSHTIQPFNFADSIVKNSAQPNSSAQTPRTPASVRRAVRPLFKRTTDGIDGAKFERAYKRLSKPVKRCRNAADYEDSPKENGASADSCSCSCDVQGVRHSRPGERQPYGSYVTKRSIATAMCTKSLNWRTKFFTRLWPNQTILNIESKTSSWVSVELVEACTFKCSARRNKEWTDDHSKALHGHHHSKYVNFHVDIHGVSQTVAYLTCSVCVKRLRAGTGKHTCGFSGDNLHL